MGEFKPLLLQSANFLDHLLPNIKLRDYQVRTAIHMALLDHQFIAFDTGLGKTVATLAGLVAKKNYGVPIRALILCPLAGMNQVHQSIQKFTKFRAIKLSGSEKGMISFSRKLDQDVDIVLCNYEAFDNPLVLELMHDMVTANYFNTIVCDEAHTFANIYSSNRNFFIGTLVSKIKYRYMLTATPIISKVEQYATLLALMLGRIHELGQLIQQVKDGSYQHHRVPHLVQFKEREVGYTVQLHKFPAVKGINGTTYGTEIFKFTRSGKSTELDDKLIELIRNAGKKLLIFSHLKENHDYLKNVATYYGRKVGIISGDTKKEEVQQQFNDGVLDCIIFSIPTELNLPADEIIMYDWTSMAHQAIGRGIRSTSAEGYVAHFLLTETEKEVTLFNNTVIKNSLFLSEAFGKDIEPLLSLGAKKKEVVVSDYYTQCEDMLIGIQEIIDEINKRNGAYFMFAPKRLRELAERIRRNEGNNIHKSIAKACDEISASGYVTYEEFNSGETLVKLEGLAYKLRSNTL